MELLLFVLFFLFVWFLFLLLLFCLFFFFLLVVILKAFTSTLAIAVRLVVEVQSMGKARIATVQLSLRSDVPANGRPTDSRLALLPSRRASTTL